MQSSKSRLMNLVPLIVIGVTAIVLIGIFSAGGGRTTGQDGEADVEGSSEPEGTPILSEDDSAATTSAELWLTMTASFDATPTPTYTPTGWYGSMNPTPTAALFYYPPGALVTLEDVGGIPAGTRIVVGSAWWSEEKGWTYSISTLDYSIGAEAHESQLGPAPDYDPSIPTAVPQYSDEMFNSACGLVMTTEDIALDQPVGDVTYIPAGTHVSVYPIHMTQDYIEGVGWQWMYQITPVDLLNNPPADMVGYYSAMAREDQLTPVPDATPGPKPHDLAGSDLAREIGMGARFLTTEDVGAIAAGTLVAISTGQPGCSSWLFQIVTEDYSITEWATPDQLEYAPGVTPGATPEEPWPSPTWVPTPAPTSTP
jgi:hypothetical protein